MQIDISYFITGMIIIVCINVAILDMMNEQTDCLKYGYDYESENYDINSNFRPMNPDQLYCCNYNHTKVYQDRYCEIVMK
jgi:hypothetical protein